MVRVGVSSFRHGRGVVGKVMLYVVIELSGRNSELVAAVMPVQRSIV
jgi:hypothetical protein